MDSVAQWWRNLGAMESQIQCLILLDVKARIHEEAEEIEVCLPSYPRSLQTVCIGNNEQSVGQIRIHYSKPIAEILSSTQRAPWTRARMWTIQGHEAPLNAKNTTPYFATRDTTVQSTFPFHPTHAAHPEHQICPPETSSTQNKIDDTESDSE